ncbi:MAG: hypothetical protein ABFD98_17925 [Syntrophobacteraceae bacterium]|nr:hypothetical protein [Desulfobacteraceae bacterium]
MLKPTICQLLRRNPMRRSPEPGTEQANRTGCGRTDHEGFSSGPERTGTYVVRHWRGELPLGVSCWVNAVLLSVLFHSLVSPCLGLVNAEASPRTFAVAVLSLWLIYYTIASWQYVGLWRSARHQLRRGGRRLPARAVQVFVVFGTLAAMQTLFFTALPQSKEYAEIAMRLDPCSRYTLRVLHGGTELEISGAIGFGLTDRVREHLDANPGVRIIRLNSSGGRVGEARRLHELIAKRRLATYSSQGCYSACTDAFMGGVLRVLHRDARLGFHRPFFPGLSADEAEASVRSERDFLIARGISAGFVEKALSTPSGNMWFPSTFELLQAHVITPLQAGSPPGPSRVVFQ